MAGQLVTTCFVLTSRRVAGKFDRSDIDNEGEQGLLWLTNGSSRLFMQTNDPASQQPEGIAWNEKNFSNDRLTSTDQRDICQGC